MSGEDLLILGAAGFGIWYVMQQQNTASATSPAAAVTPSLPAMALTNPIANTTPVSTPAINVQPSTASLANPIASMNNSFPVAGGTGVNTAVIPAPTPFTPPQATTSPVVYDSGPVQLISTDPVIYTPIPTPTSSGPTPPTPTVQPGVITTAPAPPASIQVVSPIALPAGWSGAFAPVAAWTASSGPIGTLKFGFSKGGNVVVPGDTWAAQITAATPNSPVMVTATQNGSTVVSNAVIGSTDSNGNFQMTAPIGAAEIGQWSRTFFVGNGILGNFNYTVTTSMAGLGRISRAAYGGWAV